MFTGIVEEIGTVQSIKKSEISAKIIIKAYKVLDTTKLGDSICTNGVCLTVTNIIGNTFEVDVMAETFRRSNLGQLTIGSRVNLERALTLETRLGGHIVSGHIDGVGEIISLIKEGNATWITIKAKTEILKYIIEKGSITIDGVSLTVAYIDNLIFKVSIIPHTAEKSILLDKKLSEQVNLECDLIGKYVEKFLGISSSKEYNKRNIISKNFLENNGFI